MYEITGIRIYPIKSCAGITLTEATLGKDGLELDRRWMVVNADGRFLTQRTHPRLARIVPTLSEGGLGIGLDGGEALFRRRETWPLGPRTPVRVWNHTGPAHEHDAQVAAFLSDLLEEPVRLVFQPAQHARVPKRRPEGVAAGLSFADAYPLLIAGQASLEELNRALPPDGAVGMDRFRPNLVVRTRRPWEEDAWNRFRLGGVAMHGVKRCERCPIIRVGQGDGRQHATEPTETLKRIHSAGGKPLFGLYAIHEAPGRLRVGDRIEAIEFGDPPDL